MQNYKATSDIDLTPCGRNDLTMGILYRIMKNFDNLFLPCTFDSSIFNRITDLRMSFLI